MNIGIDARFFGTIGKGLGRYTQKLIEHLEVTASPEDEFFIFLGRENYDEYAPKSPRFHKVLADYSWYGFGEQVQFPLLLRRYRLDLVHFPHFNVPILYRRPFVVTIHDLILLRYPTVRNTTRSALVYGLKFLAYRLVIASAVRRAKRILTVSRFTQEDIEREYPDTKGRTVVAYEGCDLDPVSPPSFHESVPADRGILSPYFLYVGNAYPHKNLDIFIPVAKRLPDIRFVLVGKEDFFYRRLKEAATKEGVRNLVFAGFVPDAELVSLYRRATAYVFPSLFEGFGLPPLEAMRLGTPVISSDRGSLPEVLGDAAIFFDPDRPDELESHVRRVLSDPDLRARYSEKGLARSGSFHWKDTAEAAIRSYHEAIRYPTS